MFSDAERELLRLLGDPSAVARAAALESRFPNPTYRRRLLWGIRRKAVEARADWELYARAARHEPRVVRAQTPEGSGEIPTVTEPLAAFFERLTGGRSLRRRADGTGRSGSE